MSLKVLTSIEMKDFSTHLALSLSLNAILNGKISKRALKHFIESDYTLKHSQVLLTQVEDVFPKNEAKCRFI